MMLARISRMSLLWKILLSTSIAITSLFALTGWIVQEQAIRITSQSLEEEVRASFRAYESLWRARAEKLASVSLVLSRMPDVRGAFSTRDQATIRDTAGEIWDKISSEDAIFLVTDPQGQVIASLGGFRGVARPQLPVVRAAWARFPNQASGFVMQDGQLYQIVVTPVYVEASREPALLNVLVAGYGVDEKVAARLQEATGGSDYVFTSGGRIITSTLDPKAAAQAPRSEIASPQLERLSLAGAEYLALGSPLLDVQGKPVGELRIYRSFAAARQRLATLQRNMILIWLIAIIASLGLTYLLAKRILEPVQKLDRAAAEIALGNYQHQVPVESLDELGRLARTFNAMCASIQSAREELIRQERISTIGRLSTSLVHDLRNPLAAIYGGAEMLVDHELSPVQVKRLATNIYASSRRIQELLEELVDVSRGRTGKAEPCRLRDVIGAAQEACAPAADANNVAVTVDVPEDIELPLERSRVERVFFNLMSNALDAMPRGGALNIAARRNGTSVLVEVQDTGPGVSEHIAARLFQPFVNAGKKNGLGLGLALSRQTALDHGGDMWLDVKSRPGARFVVKLPM